MKLGFTTLLATALAALLLVPAAGAGPGKGNGNGNGNGPPAWAGGGGNGGAEAGGKPDWAGKPATKPDKPGRPAAEADDDQPRHSNPAWICKFERERMGAEAFAEDYGTNDNKANAFGKCVSLEAHERDGVEPVDEETPAPEEGETSAPDDPADDDPADDEETGEDEATSSVQAFFRYLWPVLYA